MPDPERTERHVPISDADERVVELDEPQEIAPPTDEMDPEVTPVPPTEAELDGREPA